MGDSAKPLWRNAKRMDWNYLKYIEAISLTGNLSKAARMLGIDTSTLSRSLQKLETEFGVKIFKRQKNEYVITPAGHSWVRCAQLVRGHIDELAFSQGSSRAPVVVTSLELFFNHFLLERIAHFSAKLEFIGADRRLDLSRREADVAIRFGKPRTGDFFIQKLFVAGHAVYAGRNHQPQIPKDLKAAPWVILNDEFENIDDRRWFRENINETQVKFKASSCEQILTLLRSAPLLGILPCYMGDSQPDLVRVSENVLVFQRTAWLVVHRELAGQPHIRTFINELKRIVKTEAELLAGIDCRVKKTHK
jgi:DNA-binding transcriptional LysR family regulator